MVEEDYVLRQIKDMIRAIAGMLFHINTDTLTPDILEDQSRWRVLSDLIDQGKINDAENQLSVILEPGNMEAMKTALLFYSRLNEKSEDYLQEHDYSREEVKSGMMDVITLYGIRGVADVF